MFNDLKDILDPVKIQHILYTDDLQIYVQVSRDRILKGIGRLSDAVRSVSKWAESANLRLNAGKTQDIVFGSSINIR